MASTLASYGNIKMRKLEIADEIIAHGTNDNDYEMTLSFPNLASDATLNFPSISSTQTLLHDGSVIEGDSIDINNTTVDSNPADADEILVYSNSSASNRKISLQNIKSYIDHDHSSSLSGGFDVGDGAGAFVERQMSGGATMDSTGSVTIAKDPTVDGTGEANRNVVLDASRAISNVGNITSDGDFTTTGDAQVDEIKLGGNTAWKIRVNSGNLEIMKWDGSQYQVHQVFT